MTGGLWTVAIETSARSPGPWFHEAQQRQRAAVIVEIEAWLPLVAPAVELDLGKPSSLPVLHHRR